MCTTHNSYSNPKSHLIKQDMTPPTSEKSQNTHLMKYCRYKLVTVYSLCVCTK